MKNYIIDFLAGVLIVVLVLLTMNFITLDLRIVTFLGTILLAYYSYLISSQERKKVLTIILVCIPISLGFILGILPELPSLWTAIPVFIIASFTGFQISKRTIFMIGGVLITTYSFFLVPKLVESNLSQFVDEDLPNISFQMLKSDMRLDIANQQEKVTVLDFYGTWCKPCIEEISELKKIKAKYLNDKNVEFILICTEFGNDTPEKAKEFIEKRNLGDFIGVFDNGNQAHKALGFSGVPALVVIDRKGSIKFKHEGYNASENLGKTLTEVIDSLIKL